MIYESLCSVILRNERNLQHNIFIYNNYFNNAEKELIIPLSSFLAVDDIML